MDDRSLAAFRNRRIGFVFQFHYLLSELTALENVMVPALILGLSRARAREKAEAVLESLGLGDRLTHRPGELSGGEQQRVAIARALVLRPPVVLADEPTGNLDERTGDRVSDLLLEMREVFGTTLVVVTHNMRLASKMDRRLELAEGRLRERPISGPDP
jgi:lipoprotein-releasing system ATP-binding protein